MIHAKIPTIGPLGFCARSRKSDLGKIRCIWGLDPEGTLSPTSPQPQVDQALSGACLGLALDGGCMGAGSSGSWYA